MKTRKNYITPEICEYSILTAAMICQSALESGGDDDYVDEGDASEYRSDWENIWANM